MPMSAEDMAALHDGVNSILDTVDAYRAACEERGYSPTAAEAMAMEFHSHLWRNAAKETS